MEELPPYDVMLSEKLQSDLAEGLQAMNMSAVDVNQAQLNEGESLSLLTEKSTLLSDVGDDVSSAPARTVSWSPPTQNWNPWLGCNIDEGPLASASMESISQDLHSEWSDRYY